jgi:hypothetical protein
MEVDSAEEEVMEAMEEEGLEEEGLGATEAEVGDLVEERVEDGDAR